MCWGDSIFQLGPYFRYTPQDVESRFAQSKTFLCQVRLVLDLFVSGRKPVRPASELLDFDERERQPTALSWALLARGRRSTRPEAHEKERGDLVSSFSSCEQRK